MALARWQTHVTYRPYPEDQARTIVDIHGTEWEVYDESAWSVALALDWDIQPQMSDPGLVFISRNDRRRLWPCPSEWKLLGDAELLGLLARAKAVT